MDILIIGASGYIGQQLYKLCKNQGYNVVGTCHMSEGNGKFVKYDLEKDNINSIDKELGKKGKEKYAVICAGESKISVCKDKYDKVYKMNVTSTIRLIKQLRDLGYRVMFCSSDNVYDGMRGNYKESDEIHPVNAYGKMKAEVEQYILEQCLDGCIVRIGKVVGTIESMQDMFRDWRDKAMKKEKIYCIQNNYFTPIYVGDVVQSMIGLMGRKAAGIFNLGGNRKYSRIELCRDFLKALGMETNIYEKPLEEFGFNDGRPLDTSMCNAKLIEHLGGGIQHSLESIFTLYRKT